MLFEAEEGLSELDGLAVLRADLGDDTGGLGLDFIHDFHGLNDADDGVGSDLLANGDEWRGVGRRGGVEGADHGGFDFGSAWGGGCRCGSGGWRGRGWKGLGGGIDHRGREGLADADLAGGLGGFEGDFETFAFHFEDGDAVLLHEVDE